MLRGFGYVDSKRYIHRESHCLSGFQLLKYAL
jgi:hypothetical protein